MPTTKTEVLKITLRKNYEWFVCYLDDENGVGTVLIYSSYGNWTFNWRKENRGVESLALFLLKTELDYLSRKFKVREVLDLERTCKVLHENLLETYLHNLKISGNKDDIKSDFVDEIRLLKDFRDGNMTEEHYYENTKSSDIWECFVKKLEPSWTHMWNLFYEDFKQELKNIVGDTNVTV